MSEASTVYSGEVLLENILVQLPCDWCRGSIEVWLNAGEVCPEVLYCYRCGEPNRIYGVERETKPIRKLRLIQGGKAREGAIRDGKRS